MFGEYFNDDMCRSIAEDPELLAEVREELLQEIAEERAARENPVERMSVDEMREHFAKIEEKLFLEEHERLMRLYGEDSAGAYLRLVK